MVKIHIIGGPGSGKSYIAQKISEHLQINCYDLDQLFWDNRATHYGIKNGPEKRDQQLQQIIHQESWIIEGVYYSWLQESFKQSDYIFILTPNVYLRDWRIMKRFMLRKIRLLPTQKKESFRSFIELIKWNHQFDHHHLRKALEFLTPFSHKISIVKDNNDLLHFIQKK